MENERTDHLDTYRLLSGATVDLRSATPGARAFVQDLALRLAQGQGYAELLQRVLRPDLPIYEGHSPLAPHTAELPAVKAARDLVYRAGVAEGAITAGPAEAQTPPLPPGLRALSAVAAAPAPAGKGLTTEPIVTVGEAMDMLGITRQAVINAVRIGRIRGEQHGKLWVLAREDVLRYQMARDDRRQQRGR
ncbi:MAG: DNA-binding protein [Myxococcales bacterium]|nr:DNA-binding protein [Myxococcales bacterium]